MFMEIMYRSPTHPVRLLCWLLLIGCLTMIFTFSTQDGVRSGSLSKQVTLALVHTFSGMDIAEDSAAFTSLHHLVRKAAHATIYCALALCCAALAHTYRIPPVTRYLVSGLISLLCASADELQQVFRSGRSGAPTDVLIDMGGALAGLMLFYLIWRLAYGRSTKSAARC